MRMHRSTCRCLSDTERAGANGAADVVAMSEEEADAFQLKQLLGGFAVGAPPSPLAGVGADRRERRRKRIEEEETATAWLKSMPDAH